jgi:PAS domain S-box-containing protein
MQDVWFEWLQRGNYLPHGYCFTWTPGLLWSMVGADLTIAASYYSIPVALVYAVRKRPDANFGWILLMFSAFIFACGTTHLLSVWTIWTPDYGIEALAKIATALISLVTAIALWPLIPKALRLPSRDAMQQLISQLQAEVQQRTAAQAALAETEESLAVTLASIGAGFIATDRDGRITRINPTAQALTGFDAAQALGRPLDEVYRRSRPDGAAMPAPSVETLSQAGASGPRAAAAMLHTREDRVARIEESAAPLRSADGRVTGLAVVFRDMTGVDLAQRESEQLAAIVGSSNDAILSSTLDGTVTTWNAAAERLSGYSAAEMLGRPLASILSTAEGEARQQRAQDLLAGLPVPAADAQVRRRDGSLLDVSVILSPMHDGAGRVVGFSTIARDISDRKRGEALRLRSLELELENRKVHHASRLKSEFLANMSHELRTPLNAILGFADLLRRGAAPAGSAKHSEFLGHITTSGQHLLRLINDVLDLSKVEAGKLEFQPVPTDVRAVVEEVVAILQEVAAHKRVAVRTEVDDRLVATRIDPSRLKQVLYNYLSNALKFTPVGGRIAVRALVVDATRWRLEVEDNGPGIAPEHLHRLFRKFEQIDASPARSQGGTGLGLSLTRRLVKAQGGEVGVHSEPGVATVFHALLPRDATASIPLAEGHETTLAMADRPKVLVIEDDVQDQSRLAAALQLAGFAVEVTASGAEAIEAAERERYAAITLDLLLPDRPGLEVLGVIRAQGRNIHTPVVVVTMLTEHAVLAGFPVSDVLSKPIDRVVLRRALSRAGVGPLLPGRVMVVDDDPHSGLLMKELLESEGYAVWHCSSGAEALRSLGSVQPSAFILDLMMPVMDGFQLLDHLRQMPAHRSTPVFIWTSKDLSRAEYQRLATTAQAVLQKGRGDLREVLRDVQSWLPLEEPPESP